MCENVPLKTTINNIPVLGYVINDESSNLTSIGHTNPILFGGFRASDVKMSKDSNIIAAGSRQSIANFSPVGPTNRAGLHIYMKKAGVKGCCSKIDADLWQHCQTILFDDEDELVQIDRLEISNDGSSIVALGGENSGSVVYVFEEIDKCSKPKWVLQQKIVKVEPTAFWSGIVLDETHHRLIIQVTEADESINYDVYERKRLRKKCSNSTEDVNAFKFSFIQRISPIATEPNVLIQIATLHALSLDGNTFVVILVVVTNAGTFVHLLQYDFDCNDHEFKKVADVPINLPLQTLPIGINFGGPCSERLFILFVNEDEAYVEVYSREKLNQTCFQSPAISAKCCKQLKLFDDTSLIATVHNVITNPLQNEQPQIVANPFDSKSFVIFETVCGETEFTIRMTLWTQCKTDVTIWCKQNILADAPIPQNVCFGNTDHPMLSQDATCGNYYFSTPQQFQPITFGTFTNVFVNDPDGFYYLNASHGVTNEEIYFRVTGDTKYTLFNKALPLQALRFCTTNFCKAKTLELVLVDGPAPVDFVADPSLIKAMTTIPIQTQMSVICFQKNF